MYSDVFGLSLPNNKLIADAYAKSGEWLDYLPDFFKGDRVPLSMAEHLIPVDATKQSVFRKYTGLLASIPSFFNWQNRHRQGPTDAICMEFLRALRRERKGMKIGMVGFCWVGEYAIGAGLEENMIDIDGARVPLVDALVALHPSHLAIPDDDKTLVVPVSLGWRAEDSLVDFKQMNMVKGVHADNKASGREVPGIAHHEYKPGRHGFAVRGNPDDPQERKYLEDSVTQVLTWFGRWL
jgi:dienelactone hydrolase